MVVGVLPRRRPTMTDVAKLAGVSQSSVSLVLNRMTGARISEATRERVEAAAEAVGYQLNPRRTAPDPARPRVIAYFVDEISTSPHPVVNVDGAREAAWEAGYLLQVYATRGDLELEAATVAAARSAPLVVGAVYSTIFTREVTVPSGLAGLPLVLLNCYAGKGRIPSIVPGEVAGGFTATARLLRAGHRRIGVVAGEPWMDATRDRLKGHRQALATVDIAFDGDLVRFGDWLPDTGYRATLELMRLSRPPSALFCMNDLMAIGALEALRELGRKVPGDVALVGYDDQELARYTHPPLTTVLLPNYECGRTAVETLIPLIDGGEIRRPHLRKIECPLVERETVAMNGVTPPPTSPPRAMGGSVAAEPGRGARNQG